jgi:hypothetical protein
MKWSVKMLYKIDLEVLQDYYAEYLETECKCDLEEDGCSCMDFDTWLEEKEEFEASCREDFAI